uniref:RNA-binding protein n=1 Tax=uncultured bacterium pAW1 TaxID=1781155 RepID=A0A1C9U4R0_9BACT|nr:RNA-binding protein [uncultured bacterium pAW1]
MNIFVGNLPYSLTQEELREAFEAFGQVTSVAIITDKFTGNPRGFGFVEMADNAEGQAAIDGLNGRELKGRALSVNEARPKEPRSFGGGRDSRGERRPAGASMRSDEE